MWPHVIGAGIIAAKSSNSADWVTDLCSRNKTPCQPTSGNQKKLTITEVDREGYQEPLRFPPFHQEILHASSWDAAQHLGRIRIVMTEGFSRETSSPPNSLKHSFVRIRDVLAFSFQHAPMRECSPDTLVGLLLIVVIDILEFSGIAWPNPGMWTQAQSRNIQGPIPSAQRTFIPDVKEDEDAHAHSPRRPSHQDVCVPESFHGKRYPDYEDCWANQSMAPPQVRVDTAAWNQSQPADSTMVRQNGALADPFLEPRGLHSAASRREQKKSSEDTPMPDVPSYEAGRNLSGTRMTSMTGMSYEQKNMPSSNVATHEAIMNQLVEALSPLKSDDEGPHNTTNTPSSGRVFMRPSMAAQARALSRQLASPRVDKHLGVGEDMSRKTSSKMISANPGCSVQSRKEGEDNKENTPETRVAGAEFPRQSNVCVSAMGTKSSEKLVGSTDSKRKRPLEEICPSLNDNCIDDPASSSPSKKVSKMASVEGLLRGQSPRTPDRGREVSGGVIMKVAVGEE